MTEKIKVENTEYPQEVAEMELELLGMTILKNGQCIPSISQFLTPADFDRAEYQILFDTIQNLHAAGEPVTMPKIGEYLHNHNALEKVGYNLIMDLGQAAFTDAYAESYAKTIKNYSLKRQADITLQKAQDALKRGNNLVDISRNLLNFFDGQSAQITKMPIATRISDYFNGANSPFRRACAENQKFASRKCGFFNLDENQLWTNGLYIIGAPPAVGKTTFCWQLLEQFAERGEHCVFISGEMSTHEMLTKSLTRRHFLECRRRNLPPIPSTVIKTGGLQNYAESAVNQAVDANLDEIEIPNLPDVQSVDLAFNLLDSDIFRNLDLQIIESPNADIDSVLMNLRGYVKDKPSIVCLDYLQLFKLANETAKTTESDRLQVIMSKLKDFSRRFNALFIVISAFNRESYSAPDALKCFRGSSTIEYTADVIFTLSLNPATMLDENGRKIPVDNLRELQKRQPRPVKLTCIKNRHGNIFDCYFNYFSAYDCFDEVDNPDRIDEGEKTISAQNAGNATSDADLIL